MQHQFSPEETPQYQTPAPLAQETEAVAETKETTKNPFKTADLQAAIEAAKRIVGRRAGYFVLGGYAAIFGPMFSLTLATAKTNPISGTSAIAASVACFLAGSVTMYLAANRGKPYRDYSRLVQTYGADAIPLLLQWRLNSFSRANTRAVDAALLEALALADADTTCLSEQGSSYLRLILRFNAQKNGRFAYKPALCLAVLAALNRTGDPSYLSLVEKLAALNARTPDAERIRDAAAQCLPLLRERERIVGAQRTSLPRSEAAATDAALENTTVGRERLAQLRRLSRRHKARPAIGAAALCGTFALINIYINIVNSLETARAIYQSMFIFLAVFCGAGFGAMWWLLRGSRLKAQNLNQYGGLKTAGALIEMLPTAYTPPDKEALQTALIPLLLQLRPEDSSRLNRRQRAILNRRLHSLTEGSRLYEYAETFDLAILQALEQVGDRSAVPVVEKLTRMDADTPAKIRVRHAAIDCLPLLQIRAGLVAEAKTLLRASAPEAAGHDTLLRAASGPTDKAPEQLLRPSDSGE